MNLFWYTCYPLFEKNMVLFGKKVINFFGEKP
jgi:hypothetical protein